MATSTIDSFLTEILRSVQAHNSSRLAEFIVLNFDSLSPARQKPYGDLHNELNERYPASQPGKDASLSVKVKQSLTQDVLGGCQPSFSEVVVIYFRYVRDFPGDSALVKARKIEKLTRQCILTLRDDQPGPLFTNLVLHLTSTLRQVAVNLDRDPTLTAGLTSTEDGGSVSFVENTGNVLREAFNKIVSRCRPTVVPSSDRLDSGLYLILNSCLSLYARAGKLRNGEFLLGILDRQSPPLSYYPAAQRVTYLYYLGRFHFGANHFYRAVLTLQSAYDQCAKNTQCVKQRRRILTYLIASGMCIGRMPGKILMLDQAAHGVSKPFLELARVIRSGDVGRFHTLLDYTKDKNITAQWFLSMGVILQLRSRCEVLCWRSLVLKSMRYAGHLPAHTEQGKAQAMPYVRFTSIMDAAKFSYASARAEQFVAGDNVINIGVDEDDELDYVDPDLVEDHDEEHHSGSEMASHTEMQTPAFGSGMFSQPAPAHTPPQDETPATSVHSADHVDHLPLVDPTAEEINSTVLSLIAQGFLKGFVAHSYPDILQSRFAIPGARRAGASGNGNEAWREVGFPPIWQVVREKEEALMDAEDDVPGWVTEGKVRRRQSQGGGGNVVRITGARPVGMG